MACLAAHLRLTLRLLAVLLHVSRGLGQFDIRAATSLPQPPPPTAPVLRLTATPSHVTKGITKNMALRCEQQTVTAPGNPVTVPGNPTAAPGNPTAALGNPTDALGNPIAAPENPTAALGNPTDALGNPIAAPENPTAALGNPTAAPGNPTAAPGNPTGALGNPTTAPGNTTAARQLTWLRILKRVSTGWTVVAQARDGRRAETTYDPSEGVTAAGSVITDGADGAYLEVRWPVAGDTTSGVYKCDAMGLDGNQQFVIDHSPELEVREENVTTTNLLDLLIETNAERKDELEAIAEVAEENSSLIGALLERTAALERKIDEHHHEEKEEEEESGLLHDDDDPPDWPAGEFGLLMPESGCPADFRGGNSSYVRFHREWGSSNCTGDSSDFHLSKPQTTTGSGESCFLNLRFCEADVGHHHRGNTTWPEGSYCINKMAGYPCVPGFHHGHVRLDQVDGSQHHEVEGSVAKLDGSVTQIDFCCRDDAHHSAPVSLPTASPFYLYRYRGACQHVLGMRVTPEHVDVHTENFRNIDNVSGHHADVSIVDGSPTRLELCYYTTNA